MSQYELDGVRKTVAVLRALAATSDIGVADLSRSLGFGKTTTFRILYTLEKEGLVHQNDSTRRYRLGADLAVLGRAAEDAFDLRSNARPVMEKLAADTGLPVFLNVAGAKEVVCLEHVASLHTLELSGRAGRTLPYHACPSGYVLLANGPDELVQSVMAGELKAFASRTPDAGELAERIERAKEQGYAFSDSDLDEGVASLAAPIHDIGGEVIASLGLAGFSVIFESTMHELVGALLGAAAQISQSAKTSPVDDSTPVRRSTQ